MKFRAVMVGALVVVALLVVLKLTVLRGDTPRPTARSAGAGDAGGPLVTTEVITSKKLADRVSAIGTVLPDEEVEVRSEVAGRVVAIGFDEGARVEKGRVLVRINDSELRAQLARAESRLAIARDEASRQKQLYEQNLTSEREYNNALNEANVSAAEADLIRAQLAKMEIRAPFAGMVGLRNVSEGSYVSPATPITTLKDVSHVKLDFTVPERYAGMIRPGVRVTFRVQGARGDFEAEIYALEAGIDETTRTLRVRARGRNPGGALLPGAFADVSVPLETRDAITVPAYALVPELKGHQVFVYANGNAESRSVVIGTRSDERVEILSGLEAGDTLITSALLLLKHGSPVRLAGAR
jgi:membrane fusion protein (multidrug efflux system)